MIAINARGELGEAQSELEWVEGDMVLIRVRDRVLEARERCASRKAQVHVHETTKVERCCDARIRDAAAVTFPSFTQLARMDSNHDSKYQKLVCYRYTTGQ